MAHHSNSTEVLQVPQVGTLVRIHGLVKSSQHNGKIGTVVEVGIITSIVDDDGDDNTSDEIPYSTRIRTNSGRVRVKLKDGSDQILSVKVENLEVAENIHDGGVTDERELNANNVFSKWNNMFLCRRPEKHDYRNSTFFSSGCDDPWLPEVTILQDDIDDIQKFDGLSFLIPVLQSVAPVMNHGWNAGYDNLLRDIIRIIQQGQGLIKFSDYIECVENNLDPECEGKDAIQANFSHKGDSSSLSRRISGYIGTLLDPCFEDYNDGKNTLENHQICAICLEDITTENDHGCKKLSHIYRLPCEHAFHTDCLEMWRQSSPSAGSRCPQCNDPLPCKVIQRLIQIPNSKHWLEGGESKSFEFHQKKYGNDREKTWRIPLLPNSTPGNFILALLPTNGELIQPEPSSESIEDLFDRTLARQTRGVRLRRDSIHYHLDSDPRFFVALEQVDCDDCGCKDSWTGFNDDFFCCLSSFECTDLSTVNCDEATMDFEELLSSTWKNREGYGCFPCHNSQSGYWRYEAKRNAWYISDALDYVDQMHNNFIATLPPLLDFELERVGRSKIDGESRNTINFTDVSFPQVVDMEDYIPKELRYNGIFSKNGTCTKYNLRFLIIRRESNVDLSSLNDATVPIDDESTCRFIYWFKSLRDNKWYEFDVCKSTARPMESLDNVSRISSREVHGLMYVRQDLDVP